MALPWLDPNIIAFPDTATALESPNGLLAAGGGLSIAWLQAAYRRGIFPWYEEGQPILWWTPNPRLVLRPENLHVSRSLRRFMRGHPYRLGMDEDFAAVIQACAEPRADGSGTWITGAMRLAYNELHAAGLAHSLEVWEDDELVGGLYGVALGKVFFGESMFGRRDNASKLALVTLVKQLQEWGFELIDCQVRSEHLLSMGAEEISRVDFESRLRTLINHNSVRRKWQLAAPLEV